MLSLFVLLDCAPVCVKTYLSYLEVVFGPDDNNEAFSDIHSPVDEVHCNLYFLRRGLSTS